MSLFTNTYERTNLSFLHVLIFQMSFMRNSIPITKLSHVSHDSAEMECYIKAFARPK